MYQKEVYRPNNQLFEYLIKSRHVGHTTLSIEGAKSYDRPFYIVGLNLSHAKNLESLIKNKNGIPVSVDSLIHTTLGKYLPIFMDNGVLISTLSDLDRCIDDYKEILNKVEADIKYYDETLNSEIRKFDRSQNVKLSNIKKLSLWDRIFNFKKIMRGFVFEMNSAPPFHHVIHDRKYGTLRFTKKQTKNWF
jgi:hypothetical protein